jgi:hypothetical protein
MRASNVGEMQERRAWESKSGTSNVNCNGTNKAFICISQICYCVAPWIDNTSQRSCLKTCSLSLWRCESPGRDSILRFLGSVSKRPLCTTSVSRSHIKTSVSTALLTGVVIFAHIYFVKASNTRKFCDEGTLTLQGLNLTWIIYINSVCTSQETHYVSATNTSRLMLFRKMAAVYCENKMKYTNTVFWENPELKYVKACGIYNNHWALKGECKYYVSGHYPLSWFCLKRTTFRRPDSVSAFRWNLLTQAK